MDGRYPPYPAYKPSGVDWLGEIPAHWEVRRLKFVGRLKSGSGFPDVEQGLPGEEIPFYKVSDMNLVGNEVEMRFHNNSISRMTAMRLGAYIFPSGTIIFPKVGAALLTNKRRIASHSFCIDNNTMGFIPSKGDVRYLYYHLCILDFGLFVNPGAVPSINEGQVKELSVSFPPLPEQRAIAEYLDRETAHIDALIAHKRDLLDLLERQRAALISHAVTKGLNPAAPMKDSGIPWLGEIPSHWDVRRLKFVASINPDTLPEITPKDYAFAYIDIGNVSSDGNVSDPQEYTFEAAPTRARRKVNAGDTIISTVRTYLQAIAYIEDNLSSCIVSTGFAVLRPMESVYPRFLYYLVRSQGFVDAVMAHSNGVSYPAINPSTLAGLWGLLPPLSEQRAIAEYLDRETARIDRLKGEIEASIDLLQRYRAALVSAAVTGKIMVIEN